MSRRKCSYFNCNNIQKNTNNTFHTFPSDNNLLKKWIINSGNIELDAISPKKLKNRFLCSEHFENNQYSNHVDPKSRLNANAVPKKYCEVEHVDISIPAVNILNSPKSWDWNVFSIDIDQEVQPQKYDHVNEVLITTLTKVKKNRNTIEEGLIFSPETLKVLTPKYKYDNNNQYQITDFHTPKFNYILSPSVTPRDKSWVSALIDLPSSPPKKSKLIESKKKFTSTKIISCSKAFKKKTCYHYEIKKENNIDKNQKYIKRKSIFSQSISHLKIQNLWCQCKYYIRNVELGKIMKKKLPCLFIISYHQLINT